MCGIVAVAGHPDAAKLAHLGLFALQHRGQESAGIAVSRDGELSVRLGMGLVNDVFDEENLRGLHGPLAIGHVRYSTSGSSSLKNAQPLLFKTAHGQIAIAHNGNLTNAAALRDELEGSGAIFQSTSDSEVFVHLLARKAGSLEDALIHSLSRAEGAYSLLFLTKDAVVAARDPMGFRPLVIGRVGGAHVFASETTALNLLGAEFVREVEPGEMVTASASGGELKSVKPFGSAPKKAMCVFEHVYFARPDSSVFGSSVQVSRTDLGRELAREMRGFLFGNGASARADMVVPVPDSGVPAALGFSQESGIPFTLGFIRSHYVGRTFIQPAQGQRDQSVLLKLSPIQEVLKGKRLLLVDDSIVRGTTSRKICRTLRAQGVKEIHVAIPSPPIVSPCYYGIDTPEKSQLIAANHSVEEIRKFLEADSLHYLSPAGLLRAVAKGREKDFCTACFTGRYPTPLTDLASGRLRSCA